MRIEKFLFKHYSKYLNQAKDDLLIKWKKIDDKIYRKKPKHLIIKDYCKKTIWTPYTDLLTFTRRRYYDKKKRIYRYLLDEHLNLDKYKFINKHYQKLAIFNFEKFMSYKDIAKIIFNARITKQSIHNFIKEYEVKFSMDNYICNNDGILWINADGMWIKQNKTTKDIEVKNFVLFSGRKRDPYTQKWKLEGRTLKHFVKSDINTIAKKLENIILQYDDVREIRLVGDGANWIKNLAKKIGAIFYIDKFHYHKYINDLTKKDFSKKKQIYELINKEYKKSLFKINLLQIVAHDQYGELTKKQLKLIGYLTNNYYYYIRNIKYDNPINCIEAMQSQYQARYFKNRRKGWSIKILNKLISFIYSRLNGGDTLEIDIGKEINYPLLNSYGIRGSVPGMEDPRIAKLITNNIYFKK